MNSLQIGYAGLPYISFVGNSSGLLSVDPGDQQLSIMRGEFDGFHTYVSNPLGLPCGEGMHATHSPLSSGLAPLENVFVPQWPNVLSSWEICQASLLPTVAAAATQPSMSPMRAKSSQSNVSSTLRKKLTNDDRRRICQYHQKYPAVKQAEIGGTPKHNLNPRLNSPLMPS